MTQVKSNRWENEDGSYIYKDEFGTFTCFLMSDDKLIDYEVADSFDKAVSTLNALYERN